MDIAVFGSPEDIIEKPFLIDAINLKQRVRRAQLVINREHRFVGGATGDNIGPI